MNRRFVLSLVAVLLALAVFPSRPSAAQLPTSPLADQTWVRLGGPLGGLGYDIRMRPDNPDIMYVTDAFAGVHMSTDGGRTWFPINEGIDARSGRSGDAIPVFSLTIDPNTADVIWAGTQDVLGIYRSEDGGHSWERRVNGIVEQFNISFRGFSVEPGNSDVVYAAGEIGSPWWSGQPMQVMGFDIVKGVVYKSTDSGLTWREIWRGDNLARYVWIDPTDVDILYISTGIFDRMAANSNYETGEPGGEGVYKSTDGGETWAQINEGLNNLYVGSLFMHPENPLILIAGAGHQFFQQGGGVYLSLDGGEHWDHVLVREDYDYIGSVEIAVSDPNVAYAGGEHEFAISTDGGFTWESLVQTDERLWGPPNVRTGFPIDFQVDPRDPMRILANNYGGGNFLSEDGGKTWVSASTGYTGALLADVAVNPDNPAIVYANGRSGPFMSRDGGKTWVGINTGEPQISEGACIVVDPHNPNHVIMTHHDMGITYSSEDEGQTWITPTNYWQEIFALPDNQQGQGFRTVAFAPSEPDKVYGGFGLDLCVREAVWDSCSLPTLVSVLTSEDGGITWARQVGTVLDGLSVTKIVVHPTDADRAWAATMGGEGVYRTTDGGVTWEPPISGLSTNRVMGLSIDTNNPDVLYAATNNGGIFKSEDDGETWQRSSTGMDPNEPLGAVVVDPVRSNVVYAGSWTSGVYLSEDSGATWRLINEGLRTRSVRSLAISSDGETLYAATFGEGVFRLSTLNQEDFNELTPLEPLFALDETGIQIDGNPDDWSDRVVLYDDPVGDAEDGFLDLTTGYAFLADEALYFAVETVDPGASIVQFDIIFEVDNQEFLISMDPLGRSANYEGGRTIYSKFSFDDALEARVDLRDFNNPDSFNIKAVNVMVGEVGADWRVADEWRPGVDTPEEEDSYSFTTIVTIRIDGSADDWTDRVVLHDDPAGDAEEGFLDLTTGYAFVTDDALYFLVETVDPNAPYVHFDIQFQADDKFLQISWKPGDAGWLGDYTSPANPIQIGEVTYSTFAFSPALEGRIDLRDIGSPENVSLVSINAMAGEGATWRAVEQWQPEVTTPGEEESFSTETPTPRPTETTPLTPTSVAAPPSSTPPPAQPTAPPEVVPTPAPEPPAGRGICGGAAALPLVLVGLVWINRRGK